MKKKIFMLLGAVVLLCLLCGIYFLASAKKDQPVEEPMTMEDIGTQIVDGKDVKNFSVTNPNGSFEFIQKDKKWSVEGYDNDFNSSAIATMASIFKSLYAERDIEENAADLAKYGLDKPTAVATSGNTVISIGLPSADKKYYYVKLNDINNVYLVNSARLDPVMFGFDDIVDKALPTINSDSIQEISIDYSGSDDNDIVVKYDKDNPLAREYSDKNGLATLVMEKPVSNMLVYPYNLQMTVLKNLKSLAISKLVEIKPNDLAKYGLDNPYCTIYVADKENNVTVAVGNKFADEEGNNFYYVQVNGRGEVFTVSERAIKPFVEAKVADFVEKFVSLYQRSNVSHITIEGAKKYDIDFKAEGENDYREVDDGVTQDFRSTYLNGKLIERDVFTDLYELIVGISFDDILNTAKPEGEPEVTITFELTDGSKKVDNYYNYNDSFYIVSQDNNNSLVVSKQTVRNVINKAEELSK